MSFLQPMSVMSRMAEKSGRTPSNSSDPSPHPPVSSPTPMHTFFLTFAYAQALKLQKACKGVHFLQSYQSNLSPLLSTPPATAFPRYNVFTNAFGNRCSTAATMQSTNNSFNMSLSLVNWRRWDSPEVTRGGQKLSRHPMEQHLDMQGRIGEFVLQCLGFFISIDDNNSLFSSTLSMILTQNHFFLGAVQLFEHAANMTLPPNAALCKVSMTGMREVGSW